MDDPYGENEEEHLRRLASGMRSAGYTRDQVRAALVGPGDAVELAIAQAFGDALPIFPPTPKHRRNGRL